MEEFEKVNRNNLDNYKEINRLQTGTKNRIYAIVSFRGEDPIKVLACTKSGNKHLEELKRCYINKYKKIEERLLKKYPKDKLQIKLVEVVR